MSYLKYIALGVGVVLVAGVVAASEYYLCTAELLKNLIYFHLLHEISNIIRFKDINDS